LLVLQRAAVVLEVNGCWLLREHLNFSPSIIVPLFEGLESAGSAAFEAELRTKLGPVEFEGGTSLVKEESLAHTAENNREPN